MIMFLILLLHFVACFWYLLAVYSIQAGDGTWTPPFDLATGTVTNFYGDRASYQYLVTFYYSVLLLIGKANEMAPVDIGQTVYCGFILILGSFVSSFVFSNITTVMEAATQKDSVLTQRMNFIQSTMAAIKLPVSLQDEVHQYVMQVEQAPQVQYDLAKFLDSLSPNHRQQVTHYLHHRVISNLEIMENIHEVEVNFIASKLTTLLVLP